MQYLYGFVAGIFLTLLIVVKFRKTFIKILDPKGPKYPIEKVEEPPNQPFTLEQPSGVSVSRRQAPRPRTVNTDEEAGLPPIAEDKSQGWWT